MEVEEVLLHKNFSWHLRYKTSFLKYIFIYLHLGTVDSYVVQYGILKHVRNR
jgi:hypothetical protein